MISVFIPTLEGQAHTLIIPISKSRQADVIIQQLYYAPLSFHSTTGTTVCPGLAAHPAHLSVARKRGGHCFSSRHLISWLILFSHNVSGKMLPPGTPGQNLQAPVGHLPPIIHPWHSATHPPPFSAQLYLGVCVCGGGAFKKNSTSLNSQAENIRLFCLSANIHIIRGHSQPTHNCRMGRQETGDRNVLDGLCLVVPSTNWCERTWLGNSGTLFSL